MTLPRPSSAPPRKAYASDVALQVTTHAVQLLGGYGYIRDFSVERMMCDAKFSRYDGPPVGVAPRLPARASRSGAVTWGAFECHRRRVLSRRSCRSW